MSEAFAAAFRLVGLVGVDAASPNLTKRRMASERDAALLRSDHLSMVRVSSVDKRIAETGACPVAGRPLFFCFTGIEDFIIYLYYEKESRARRCQLSRRPAQTLRVALKLSKTTLSDKRKSLSRSGPACVGRRRPKFGYSHRPRGPRSYSGGHLRLHGGALAGWPAACHFRGMSWRTAGRRAPAVR
jgi:hypothetical protein